MKKQTFSALVAMALSTSVFAGGDLRPADESHEGHTFYVGGGVGYFSLDDSITKEEISAIPLTLIGGVELNDYLAVEARYSYGLSVDYDKGNLNTQDTYSGDVSTWGAYVKPMLPLEEVTVYALLGYGGVMLTDLVEGDAVEYGFQWGGGINMDISDTTSLFVDYLRLYDDTGFDYRAQISTIKSDLITVGLTYKF